MTTWQTAYEKHLTDVTTDLLDGTISAAQTAEESFEKTRADHGLPYAIEQRASEVTGTSHAARYAVAAKTILRDNGAEEAIQFLESRIKRETESYFSTGYSASRADLERTKIEYLQKMVDRWGGVSVLRSNAESRACYELTKDTTDQARESKRSADSLTGQAGRAKKPERVEEYARLAEEATRKMFVYYRRAVHELVSHGCPTETARDHIPYMKHDEAYEG